MFNQTQQQNKSLHWQAFFLALLGAAVVFVPLMIWGKGYFFYYGDFNVQQIPFYQLAHEAVRSGDIWWNWNTDLGANFIGSYSFYLLFSPFFWLTIPFPNWMLPHLMGPLLILKTGCAAFTSYFFLKRFVKDQNMAVLGSILYAFSGWAVYNVFFNHFHEPMIFFPLLLITLEEAMINRRRGAFAVAVAVNAMVNYWFFIGEVVFVVIYFFVRLTSPQWKFQWGKFFSVALESVLGLGMAMFAFLPSVLAILGNPRTGVDSLLSGWNFWVYSHGQRPWAILASLFFPPDLPSNPNMFPDHGAKWASLAAYLPMVSASGVIAYVSWAKKNWLKKMLLLCLFIALVPGLNSLFILFNNSYYDRWYYMPILLMALATVVALDRQEVDYTRGVRWTALVFGILIVAVGLTPEETDGEWHLGLATHPARFWLFATIAVVGLVLTYLAVKQYRADRRFGRTLLYSTTSFSVATALILLCLGQPTSSRVDYYIQVLEGRETMSVPQDQDFARVDFYDDLENLGMYWRMPTIQAFHSIVPVSLMEFYPTVGVKRDVSSKPQPEYYALRALLSVEWLYSSADKGIDPPIQGFSYYSTQNGYYLYRNDNYIPMGFAYGSYITRSEYEQLSTTGRQHILLHSIVLEDEDLPLYEDLLPHEDNWFRYDYELADYETFQEDVSDRRAMTASSFERDNRGFTATVDMASENLLFFSVPYDAGWSVTVDGEEAQVEQVNVGFVAVQVPAGEHTVRFTYTTPGLFLGLGVSGVSLVVLVGYLLINRARSRKTAPAQGDVQLPGGEAAAIPLPPAEEPLQDMAHLKGLLQGMEEAPPRSQEDPTPPPVEPAVGSAAQQPVTGHPAEPGDLESLPLRELLHQVQREAPEDFAQWMDQIAQGEAPPAPQKAPPQQNPSGDETPNWADMPLGELLNRLKEHDSQNQ